MTTNQTVLKEYPLFAQAFHYAPIGMAIVSLKGKIQKVNPSLLSILGYTEEELINTYYQEITYPDDLDENLTYMEELKQGLRDYYQMKKRFYSKNGDIIWVLLSVSMAKQEHDSSEFFISQVIDITEKEKAEQELIRKKKEYQLITENSVDLISKQTVDGIITYASNATLSLLGYHPDEMIGKPAYTFCHPLDILKVRNEMTNLKDGVPRTITCRVKSKENTYIWFETTLSKVVDDNGQCKEVLGFSRDISERKEKEALLENSKQRYKALFNYHPDMIYSLDLEGYYTSINAACQEVTGYTYEEVAEGTFNFRDITCPEFLPKVESAFFKTVQGEVQRYESTTIKKDGDSIELDITNIPIIIDGKVVGVFGIARNISERKHAERQMRSSKRKLEAFIDYNADPIILFDDNDRAVRVNKAFTNVFGFEPLDVLGLKPTEFPTVNRKSLSEIGGNIIQIKQGSMISGLETERIKKDGSIISVLISAFPMEDSEGKHADWAVMIKDITENKKAEEMLVRSEKLSIAGQLAAGIAHEIRNPMTSIKGFVQLIASLDQSNKKYLDIISSEIDRIELIVSELLLLAKPQTVQYKKVNIHTLLEEVRFLLESQSVLNNVDIEIEQQSNSEIIYCEPHQIKQVCINFMKNSIEAMPSGGKLLIQIGDKRNGIHIRFIDQGVGIPQHILEKLGQPFYTTKEKGTGLGFMVSKKIIENHKGIIEVNSELNKGTTIEVFLPFNYE